MIQWNDFLMFGLIGVIVSTAWIVWILRRKPSSPWYKGAVILLLLSLIWAVLGQVDVVTKVSDGDADDETSSR